MRRFVVPILVLSATLLGVPAAASAAPPAVRYVALGDSYSSGVGTRIYDPASGACLRSPLAYPRLWQATHPVASATDVACSGAASRDVVANQVPAVGADTTLVTVTAGGDDVGFAPVLRTCSLGTDAQCAAAVAAAAEVARTLLPGRLDAMFAAIRVRAGQARIVVLGYPRLFGTGPCTALGLPDAARRALLDQGADLLDGVIMSAAARNGATFVDVRARFAAYGTCAPLGSRWINPPTVPLTESYHPNALGHALGYLPALDAVTGAPAPAVAG